MRSRGCLRVFYPSYHPKSTSGCFLSSSMNSAWISVRRSGEVASNLKVRFGLVFDARTAPQESSSNLTRTPSIVMHS